MQINKKVVKGIVGEAVAENLLDTVPEMLKEYLSASIKPERKKSKYSLEQEKAQIIEMIKNTVRETAQKTIKSVDIDNLIFEKLMVINWKEEAKKAAELAIKKARGIVE